MDESIGKEGVTAILMAVHGGDFGPHFEAAIDSIYGQSYQKIRVFLYVDGPVGSEIERIISDKLRVQDGIDRVIRSETPKGLASGLNKLIDAALLDREIQYFARMDADDISAPSRIETQVTFLDSTPQIDICGTWCIEFSQPGKADFYKCLPTTHEDITDFMITRTGMIHPSVVFSRRVLSSGFRYDPKLKQMQDLELWSRLILAGFKFANIPEFLIFYRMSPDSFFSRRTGVKRGWLEVKLHLCYAIRAKSLRPKHVFYLFMLFLLRISPKQVKKFAYSSLRR